MLILYPNYSLEIVGNYLAFPFQVVLLVSFKSKFILTQISTLWSFQCSALLSKLVRSQRTSLLYRMSFNLSRTFFNFFRSVFSVHFHASQCLVYDVVLFLRVSLTAWLSYQRYALLSTLFSIFFSLFLLTLFYPCSYALFSRFLFFVSAYFTLAFCIDHLYPFCKRNVLSIIAIQRSNL